MKLSKKARENLKEDRIKMLICLELGITFNSLYRWIWKDSKKISQIENLKVISKYTGLPFEEIWVEDDSDV